MTLAPFGGIIVLMNRPIKQRPYLLLHLLLVLAVVVLLGLGLLTLVLFAHHGTKKPTLQTISYCSDICPQSAKTYRVYKGVTSDAACAAIDGRALHDPAWNAYIGCAPTKPR